MYLTKFITFVILVFTFFGLSKSSNILGLMGSASHSHHLWSKVLFEELSARGHRLTIVSTELVKNHDQNISFIHLDQISESINAFFAKNDNVQKAFSTGSFSNLKLFYDYQIRTCQGIVKSAGFETAINLLESMEFDLILYDISNGPCLIKLIETSSKSPVIGISASQIMPAVFNTIGGHSYPAITPFLTANYDFEMNFWKRAINTALYVSDYLYKNYVSYPVIEHMVKDFFPEHNSSITELEKRIQLILIGTHPSLDNMESLARNVIEVGGLHIKKPKPLPNDIQEFIGTSSDGFVFISLGSSFNICDEMIGEDRLNAIVKVIQRFPKLKFLWKLQRNNLIKKLPKNLLIRKWFPQNDILAHQNIRAYFTNADSLSIQEATYYGVPLLLMPILLDQNANAHRANRRGVAEMVNFSAMNEATLLDALEKLLKNPKYAENQKKISIQFKAGQNQPLDTAIWWIEHIIQNPNSDKFFASPSRDLSFFKVHSLDMLAILLIFILILIGNTIFVFKQIFFNKKEIKKVKKNRDLSKINKKLKLKTKTN